MGVVSYCCGNKRHLSPVSQYMARQQNQRNIQQAMNAKDADMKQFGQTPS